jgi:hypothetical protein
MDFEKSKLIAAFQKFKSYCLASGLPEEEFLKQLSVMLAVINHNKKVDEVIKAIGNELKWDKDYSALCCHVSRLEDLARRKYV